MYHMTVYDNEGNKRYDEPIEAVDDQEAKAKGLTWITENGYGDCPYRIFHTSGRLIAFQSHQAKRV